VSLLSWLFGKRTQQLATEGSDAGGAPTGDELQAYTGLHEFPAHVRRIIGEFKPQAVTMQRRIQMRYSPDVAFMSALVRAPIINMRYTIESDDPQLAAEIDAMLRPHYVTLAKAASLALLYGFQVVQPVYEPKPFEYKVEDKAKGESKNVRLPIAWVPKRFKGIDPRTLTLKADPRTEEFLLAEQDAEGRTIRVPAEQLILWTHGLEDDWGRLTGFGVYDNAYEPWYAQSGLILLRNSYFERRADPTPIGYFREGQGTDEKAGGKKTMRELMGDALAAIKARSFVLLPGRRDEKGNRENEITYLADDKRGDMFQQAIDAEGVRILKCGLIPGESATSEPMGSRARAEVHENRLGEIQQTRVDEWCGVLTAYAKRLAAYHRPAEQVEKAGIRIKASGLAPGIQQLYKEVLAKLLDAESLTEQGEAVPLKKRIDAVGMADDLGIPLRPLDEAQEEWDAERKEREAKAAEIAEGGVPITKDMEREVEKELSRIGAIE
jgi:hypothetical protein